MGREKKEERGEGWGEKETFPSLSLPPATNFLSPQPRALARLPLALKETEKTATQARLEDMFRKKDTK